MSDKITGTRWQTSKRQSQKRSELPSPAVGSPAVIQNFSKKVNTRKSPAWDPSKNTGNDATSANVNELINSNQRAFAARFGGTTTNNAPGSAATSSASSASSASSPSSMTGVTMTNPTPAPTSGTPPPIPTPAHVAASGAHIPAPIPASAPAPIPIPPSSAHTATHDLVLPSAPLVNSDAPEVKPAPKQTSSKSTGTKSKSSKSSSKSTSKSSKSMKKQTSKQASTKSSPPRTGDASMNSASSKLTEEQKNAKQEKAKAAAKAAVAIAEVNFKNGTPALPTANKVVARPGYAPVPANANPSNIKKVGPPVVENRIGMGGLQSPVQVGGAGFNSESSSKKSASSRRRSSSKKNSNKGGGGRWTKEEDQKLRAAVAAVGPQNWKMIATDYLGDQRSDVQCLHRWQKVLQPGLVKGPWTKEEDQIIIDCIDAGITKWSEIAERIPGRIGKQCRERWFNHLDPSLKKGNWTEEEDAILVEAQAKWGNCWTKIAKLLPGRSENAVKNRWNSATRRRAKASQGPDAETRYLENLGDPNATTFPDGLDTTASAVLAAARAAAAKIIAEENGKIEPEDDDPDTIKLSHEARLAMLSKKQHMQHVMMGEGSDDHLLLDEDGKPLIFDQDGLLGVAKKEDKKSDMDINSSDFFDIPDELIPKISRPSKKASSSSSSSSKKKGGSSKGKASEKKDDNEGEEHEGASSSFLFFEDQNLTEREKDLIHRAYLAGLASKADPMLAEALKGKAMGKGGSPSKKSKAGGGGKKGGNAAVQWDFNMEGSGSASGSGFGMEHVLHQHLDEDDPSLNHSLLNMSLDKDIILDEMGLSLSDKSVLTRPLSSGAMNSLHEGTG
eukprot:CAMPEP_0118650828 /NCGR_PEP_ID=MMETSP0785-20121206/10454_1 /TAXON_ID=91992 /ORGANISM="Bolidomonas pacifica, Strain CCMP 1866" /LENGTH=841 /DNA_ID=CAMNT_0006543227 /DNA_START=97 /DNA_END=2619 /DNA_ORIENTATION=+